VSGALNAAHVVAAHGLLRRTAAGRTWRSVRPNIVITGLLFLRQLRRVARPATSKVAVPTCITSLAKGEGALAANSQSIGGGMTLLRWLRIVLILA
jgi:hypothetical protein